MLLRYAGQTVKYLAIGLVVLFVMDWCVFEVRMMRGEGLSSVPVDQFLKTPLKGEKTEYDYLGTGSENCAVAVFPQYTQSHWNTPCWWLRRNSVQWQ